MHTIEECSCYRSYRNAAPPRWIHTSEIKTIHCCGCFISTVKREKYIRYCCNETTLEGADISIFLHTMKRCIIILLVYTCCLRSHWVIDDSYTFLPIFLLLLLYTFFAFVCWDGVRLALFFVCYRFLTPMLNKKSRNCNNNNNKKFKSLIIIRQRTWTMTIRVYTQKSEGLLIHTHIINLYSSDCNRDDGDEDNANKDFNKIKANTCREWQQQSKIRWKKNVRDERTTTAHYTRTCTSTREKKDRRPYFGNLLHFSLN